MKILKQLKHVSIAVLPITIILVIIDLFFFDIGNVWYILGGGFVLLIGETLFLLVVDHSIVKMGELVASRGKIGRGLLWVLLFGLVFGILSTLAEPDIQVLAGEVLGAGIPISKILFILAIGIGVGVFCVVGLARTALGVPTWAVMLLFYGVVIVLAVVCESTKSAVAFDAGSASTGVIAAPFLIALCSGVSGRRRGAKDGEFGLIGVTSIGPVLAVLVYFLLFGGGSGSGGFLNFNTGNMFYDTLITVSLAVVPMLLVFFVFEFSLMKVQKRVNLNILLSTLFMSIGLFMMIFGLEFGFARAGKTLGTVLGEKNLWWVVLILGIAFSFCLPFAEPAVRVLGNQVEEATNGNIKAKFVVFAIAFSMVFSVVISVLVVVFHINVAMVLIVLVAISLVLMFFSPSIFVAISFDSGGVALGPTSTAFLFPMIVGMAATFGVHASFGTLAVLGFVPIVVLEVLGIVFAVRTKAPTLFSWVASGRRVRSASGVDRFSDISDLEEDISKKYGGGK